METPPDEPHRPPPTPTPPAAVPGPGAVPPAPGGQSPGFPATVPRGRQRRLAFALVGGVLALLCLGGGVVAFTLYDNATKFDRSSPDAVVLEYVGDLLVHRNRVRAALWACDGAQVAVADRMLDDIIATEKRLNATIVVSAERIEVQKISATTTEVHLDIRRSATVDGVSQSVTDPLTLTVENRDGWKVCGARAP